MKILHIIFSFHTGGAETMLADMVNEQSKGENVYLIIINNSYSSELVSSINNKTNIHYINRTPGSLNPLKIIQLNYLVFKINPDIIHFHDHNAIKLVFYKGRSHTCLTVHDVNKPVENFLKYDQLFSISDAVRANILNRGGISSIRIYNGIDFDQVKTKVDYKEPKVFSFVQISRLCHEKKGQDILLKALHHLVYEEGLENIELDLIGEGPSLNYLKEITRKLEITKFVNFFGIRDRKFIYQELKNYNLLIQPSIYEGFGLTVVEGIAAGLPVLVSNIDGPAEIIKNLPSGWTFESENEVSLSKAIVEIILLYKNNQIAELCRASYSTAIKKFSIQRTSSNYIESYQNPNCFLN
jgi:glycosyltransferase involved in cell wall biosynthesis